MARRLSQGLKQAAFEDHVGGGQVVLTYRQPTTREFAEYHNAAVVRKKKKIEFDQAGARLRYGALILAGIRDGDFEVEEAGGGFAPLSSTPGNPGYRDDWKDLVAEMAPDLVMLLAAFVFDASAEIGEADGDDPGN